MPLKPEINDIKYDEINFIDFGNIKINSIENSEVMFWSNHTIPIIDYQKKSVCTGPTWSHNIRHLGDVIMTAINDLIVETFGTKNNFLGAMGQGMIEFLIFLVSFIGSQSNKDFQKLMFLNYIIDDIYDSNILNNIIKYLDDNKDLIFLQTGKLEKHGVQLGKCGNLSAGIKINRENNVIKLNVNKPLILYEGRMDKFFKNNKEYDFNTINCIVELSRYKELYYLITQNVKDEFVKKILINNIYDFSFTSEEIYNQYLEFLDNSKMPSRSSKRLKSFDIFLKDGWKIPNDISKWNYLSDYIFPDIINSNLYCLDENNQKHYFHSQLSFNHQEEVVRFKNIEKEEKDFELLRWE